MTKLYIDIETYSPVDIRKVSVYPYVEHPDFLILMAAYALDNDRVRLVIGEDQIRRIPGLWDPKVIKVAHNASFERICFGELHHRRFGLNSVRYLDPAEYHDTMAVAAERGYPSGLSQLAKWLGGEQKDEAGTRLINLFCKPNRKGTRTLPEDKPDEWKAFGEYCVQDVETLRSVDQALGDFPTEVEREAWRADQRLNDRGVVIDRELALAAEEAAEDNRLVQELEITNLTGVMNPGSQPQMLAWLRSAGLNITDLRAETLVKVLDKGLDGTPRRVVELRQELALVASKKYTAALQGLSGDGRLRGQFRFFGAHTGRWAGRGVQLHNLPRAYMADETAAEAAILDLKLGLGASAETLKALVRPMLVGPFTVVDYASIEARVLAWLAGEEWALEAFRGGRDIYVETADRMSTPDRPLTRSQGKVAVLALGYNGSVNSLRAMGADGSDAELQTLVDQWRLANPAIVGLWRQMGDAFYRGGPVGDLMTVERDGTDRLIRLPSGRAITYHGCEWKMETSQYGTARRTASFMDPKKPGVRTRTYGGRLVENVTQAVARDVLSEALMRLEDCGYAVVGHVHDEVLVEGEDVPGVTEAMTSAPSWAAGLPISAEGFTCQRYRKG